jgi:Phage integrase, N-terminal SAM-like domain
MTTPLRAKYIRDLAIRSRAERTQQSYSRYVSELARIYHRLPELISYQEVADWLYYLIKERALSVQLFRCSFFLSRLVPGRAHSSRGPRLPLKRFCCREHTRAKNLIYYLAENFRAELMV